MRIFTRLRDAIRAPAESRATFYGPSFGFAPVSGPVSPIAAENLAAISACIQAIASGIASLPCRVYRVEGQGRTEIFNHPVSRLVRTPNPRQTWPDFAEWLMGQVLLHGNGLAVVEHDGAGRPVALTPVPWNCVQPSVLPTGRLVFDVVAHQMPWGGAGLPRRLLDTDVLHLKDRSDDGWLGRSRMSRAPEVLSAAIGLQTYSSSIWENAAAPSGMVTVSQRITKAGMDRMRADFESKYVGAHHGKRVIFADPDTSFTPISVTPEDAEILASRRFTGEELARLFGVPPAIIGDLSHGTFTNSETAGRWFAQFTLAPWCTKIEAEFARTVIGADVHIELDMAGLVRGSYAERWAANVQAVQSGILLPDEVREIEGFNPLRTRPGGSAP